MNNYQTMCVGEVFELLDDLGEALFGEHLIDVAGQLVDLVLLAQLDELFHGIYTRIDTFTKNESNQPKERKECAWWKPLLMVGNVFELAT